ncbi:contact-dependent growth inhibition system immunity protein [Amycolatopsis samaneae]|uniref:Contact-dependent growth inhibition system immunity protein n=1 Tax=Amycolatopsis samaneae TaxID=664691 RepID=A0ABW5GJ80_9PSEU
MRELMDSYFHQDYDLDAETPIGVVEYFVRENPPEYGRGLADEIEALFAAGLDEEMAKRIWNGDGRANYDPTADGISYLSWFTQMRDFLRKEVKR